ncbi:hypothetical protein FRC08_004716 [Ceratobasidium sp. 394]|nr:hypothetical protein FRC08_004716 [Ceratobasidium sp. 394]
MAGINNRLEGYPLQPISLQINRGPKGVWMLPTARSKSPIDVDLKTHENTIFVKEAVMATAIGEEHLQKSRTYPNTKRPNTWANLTF